MPIPKPNANESETEYVERAHRDLADDYPDTDQRNAIIFKTWREAHGESDLDRKAHSLFGSEEYDRVDNVPVFAEHTIERPVKGVDGQPQLDDDGKPITYRKHVGLAELKSIVANSNHRIADTGSFAPISEGHNPNDIDRAMGMKSPDVLGYAGPFRLGMIGNKEPRWAIFQTEHRMKSEAAKFRKMTRRSPEVWKLNEPEKAFIDPIAALGAETPRLDMGLSFSREASGEEVLKYAAAAMAGGMDTELPEHVHPAKYEQEQPMALSPEDLSQIVAAVMETPQMRYVSEMMETRQGEQQAAQATPEGGQPSDETAKFAADEGAKPEEKSEEKEMKEKIEERKEEPREKEEYSRRFEEQTAKYRRLEAEHNKLASEFSQMQKDRTAAVRRSRLEGLRREYAFDLEKQVNYSLGLSDDAFAQHCEMIAENFQQIPIEQKLYVPQTEASIASTAQADKYSRDTVEEAMRLCEVEIKAGKSPDFNTVLAEVRAKRTA